MVLILLPILSIHCFDFQASYLPSFSNITHISSVDSPFPSHLHPRLQSLSSNLVLPNQSSNIPRYSDCFSIVRSNKLSWSKPMTLKYGALFVLIKGNEKPFLSTGFAEKIKTHLSTC